MGKIAKVQKTSCEDKRKLNDFSYIPSIKYFMTGPLLLFFLME